MTNVRGRRITARLMANDTVKVVYLATRRRHQPNEHYRIRTLAILVPTAPYLRLLQRALRGPGTPSSVSFRHEVLCPAETTRTRPAIFLPGQLDRVTAASEHLPLKAEFESMLAPVYEHAPTIAFHIKNAVLHRGSVYADNMRYFIADKRAFRDTADSHYLASAALTNTAVGYRYFGHWLRDDCIQYLLAEQLSEPMSFRINLSPHMQAYSKLFQQDWSGISLARVNHLVIFQDYAQNSLKRARYQLLSSRVAKAFPTSTAPDKLVYIKRGRTGKARSVSNEDALIDVLVRWGFEIIDVSSDLTSIVSTLRRAKLVVSVEGSNINHFNFAASPGSALLVLQPADRFLAFHRHWCECVGIRFGFVVGIRDEQGYLFPAEEVLKTSELLLNSHDTTI